MKNGPGRYIEASGKYYIGDYKDDKWNGKGTHYYADGYKEEKEYKNGEEI